MKLVFSIILLFSAVCIFSAPLEGGYVLAPRDSASAAERERAYIEARHRVIEASKKYEGTPYAYGAMSASGTDCSGFICLSFRDAIGVSLPRSASGLYSWVERIPLERAQPGDLLFFRTDSTRNITHVGLYLGSRRFIHAASAGATTGVIYSSLDEAYYANAYAGAGRAFPEASSNAAFENFEANASASSRAGAGNRTSAPAVKPPQTAKPGASSSAGSGRLLLGAAIAPTWNGFIKGGNIVRGFASQLCLSAETYSLGSRMVFGLEVRPEYDGALGVFRLPITLSWGPSEKFKIFAGPVFSFGDASLLIEDTEHRYSGGTSWLGTIGITAAPFIIETSAGEFAPYLEAAWQSYFRDNSGADPAADFSAGFRFSTGLRWTIQVNKR
jgi:hypothetical protein